MAQQIASINFHKDFKKHYQKRILSSASLDKIFSKKFQLFISDQTNPQLHDHALKGSMLGKRSFSITGDIRVIYLQRTETEVEFLDVGSHAQLYD